MIYDYNILEALTVHAIYTICIFIIGARIARRENLANWLGVLLLLTAIPLVILLIQGFQQERSFFYIFAILAALTWLTTKLVLDYLLRIRFRDIIWAAILYALLFFVATGSLLIVVAQAGTFWLISALAFYAVVVVLEIIQILRFGAARKS